MVDRHIGSDCFKPLFRPFQLDFTRGTPSQFLGWSLRNRCSKCGFLQVGHNPLGTRMAPERYQDVYDLCDLAALRVAPNPLGYETCAKSRCCSWRHHCGRRCVTGRWKKHGGIGYRSTSKRFFYQNCSIQHYIHNFTNQLYPKFKKVLLPAAQLQR